MHTNPIFEAKGIKRRLSSSFKDKEQKNIYIYIYIYIYHKKF